MALPLHVAAIHSNRYLFLRKNPSLFQWYLVDGSFTIEEETAITGESAIKAIYTGYQAWQNSGFRLLHCGFRYTLPERDEVGSDALFYQMALSYNSSNGRYFDEETGHFCYVDFASQEALLIWAKIRQSTKASVNTNA